MDKKTLYFEALLHNPTYAAAYFHLGAALAAGEKVKLPDGRQVDTKALYFEVLRHDKDPKYADAYNNLGAAPAAGEDVRVPVALLKRLVSLGKTLAGDESEVSILTSQAKHRDRCVMPLTSSLRDASSTDRRARHAARVDLGTLPSQWNIDEGDIQLTGTHLGLGGYSRVSPGIWTTRGLKVALKEVAADTPIERFIAEVAHVVPLDHENVVTTYGFVSPVERRVIVMELAQGTRAWPIESGRYRRSCC